MPTAPGNTPAQQEPQPHPPHRAVRSKNAVVDVAWRALQKQLLPVSSNTGHFHQGCKIDACKAQAAWHGARRLIHRAAPAPRQCRYTAVGTTIAELRFANSQIHFVFRTINRSGGRVRDTSCRSMAQASSNPVHPCDTVILGATASGRKRPYGPEERAVG